MNNVLPVDIYAGVNQLLDVAAGFYLVEALTTAQKITQTLVLTDVEHEVHVFGILEIAIKSDYIFVVQRGMNLNLRSQLLASFGTH